MLGYFHFWDHAGSGTKVTTAEPVPRINPLVAQLVERWTVEKLQASIGRWFKSGPEDVLTSTKRFVSLCLSVWVLVLAKPID